MWSVSSILTGLLSFMLSDEQNYGSMVSSNAEKQTFAKYSMQHNKSNAMFKSLFPDLTGEKVADDDNEAEVADDNASSSTTTATTPETGEAASQEFPQVDQKEKEKESEPKLKKKSATTTQAEPKPVQAQNGQGANEALQNPMVWALIVLLVALIIALIMMYSSE